MARPVPGPPRASSGRLRRARPARPRTALRRAHPGGSRIVTPGERQADMWPPELREHAEVISDLAAATYTAGWSAGWAAAHRALDVELAALGGGSTAVDVIRA